MRLSFVLYFSSTNIFFTTFWINIGFKMKVSAAIFSAVEINSQPDQVPWLPCNYVKFRLFHGIQWKPWHAMISMEMESEYSMEHWQWNPRNSMKISETGDYLHSRALGAGPLGQAHCAGGYRLMFVTQPLLEI